MARKSQNESLRGHDDARALGLIDSIKAVATAGLKGKVRFTYDEFVSFLSRWWCHHYRRPYKDPLLASYTLEELLFEFYDITGEENGASSSQEVPQEEYDWAAEEEAKELAEMEAREAIAAAIKNDTIPEEDEDAQWAAKHGVEPPLINPTADEALKGGDISATFED